MLVIVTFFVAHWVLSIFFQTFFHHRYGAHRMFTMSPTWERFFYLCTVFFQGSSFLNPRAYAILHREHHAYSDTDKDPHSPYVYPSVYSMMQHTKNRYQGLMAGTIVPEARFDTGYPEWPLVNRIADSWITRIAFALAYTAVYLRFAPNAAWFALLPFHYLMGPVHGAIVNWCGHKYGYRSFDHDKVDRSRNTLPFDFLTMGELFQNNHHTYGQAPNFAARWFEVDPTWWAIKLFAALGIVKLPEHVQVARYPRAEPAVSPVVARVGEPMPQG